MNGGKSWKGESRNKRKCENTKPLHSLFWIIPLRELDFQLSFFALLLTILFLRNTNVILSCFFFFLNVYILRKKQELGDEETTDETRAVEREGEGSDNDSSSGSDCDVENEQFVFLCGCV